MDYKQHKGNLRGQIKNKVERKLYNKRIRAEAIEVDTSEEKLTIPDVSNCYMADCLIQDSCLKFKQQGCNKYCKLYM